MLLVDKGGMLALASCRRYGIHYVQFTHSLYLIPVSFHVMSALLSFCPYLHLLVCVQTSYSVSSDPLFSFATFATVRTRLPN